MIISSDITESRDQEEMIAFYKEHFESVEILTCGKCKDRLALILIGGNTMGMQMNELGQIVVPMSNKLISHRIRLDEAPTGEPMIGFQCDCGNDTRISSIEEEFMPESPANKGPVSLDPFMKQKIKSEILNRNNYKPKFKKQGNVKTFETFKLERIK